MLTVGTERELLEAVLDESRADLVRCLAGLSDADARRRLVPSLTTPLGLLTHAAAAERSWFQRRLAGLPSSEWDGYAYGDDASFGYEDDLTVTAAVQRFEHACARSRAIAAGVDDLDSEVHHERIGVVTLRWIYLHMIRELARHAGHADILREQIDGATMTGAQFGVPPEDAG
ncbi:MAG: DinB family protein [Micropruina sp.]|uniref:DinB family protein n=1 Tax=Micropruina sp. TaxID=2737536 RepID=UPI0039E326CE